MKNLSKFLCLVALMFIGQSAWAAAGDQTVDTASWSMTEFNNAATGKISDCQFTGYAKYLEVYVSGSKCAKYETATTIQTTSTLAFNVTDKNETDTWNVTWAGKGADVVMLWAKTRVKVYNGWIRKNKFMFTWNNGTAEGIGSDWLNSNPSESGYTSFSSVIGETQTSIPFKLSVSIENGEMLFMRDLMLRYKVIPSAPTWKVAADNMDLTVNKNVANYQHYYELDSALVLANEAFRKDVKYELVNEEQEKYVFWNAKHTAFYAVKPGVYKVRAYIDVVNGEHCASAYTAEFALTATALDSEKEKAQVFFYVDGVMADEYDTYNHKWQTTLKSATSEHSIEYVYGYEGDINFTKSELAVKYSPDFDPRGDHLTVLQIEAQDSVKTTIDYAQAVLFINTQKSDNHVQVVLNSKFMESVLVTAATNATYVENRQEMKFEQTSSSEYTTPRSFEVTFTGVPDSLTMLYGNNAAYHSGDVTLKIEYYDGTSWKELTSIVGRPNAEDGGHVQYSYQLPPSAQKVRFTYWNAQYMGYIKDLTISERRGFTMSVPYNGVLNLAGIHQKGGFATENVDLNWYNLFPSFQDTLTQFNYDKFTAVPSGVKTLALDDYQEGAKVLLGLKLDTAGVFDTYYMVWNGEPNPMVIVPGGKDVYGFRLHGVVKYDASELQLTDTLASDTVQVELGGTLPNPFQLEDTTGNIITDSLHFEYEFFPANAAEIDSMGNIKANCVGYTRIVAKLKENMLIPGGLLNTIYMYVPENSKNVINWNLPEQIGRRDILTNVAATADSAAITYHFLPVEMATYKGNNTIQIADTIGEMYITATAGQTCEHLKVDSIVKVKILDIIEDENFIVKDSASLRDLLPGDSIKDLIVIIDPQTGDTILPPYVKTTYRFEPEDAAKVVDGNIIVVSHAVDILCIATTTGLNIKTRVDSIWLRVGHDWEEIEFTNKMLDTMLVGTEYILNQYITTMSGQGVDSLYCLPAKAYFNQAKHSIKPQDSAYVELFAIAKGNADFWGPDTASHMVHFVYGVQDINWEDLGDLSDLRVKDDTIRTSDIPVKDNKGNDITNQVTKEYEFQPEGLAHVTEDGDLVMDQAGDVTVIITTSGPGFETKKDTLYMHADGYQVAHVVLPEGLNYLHVGDSVSLAGTKVYDQDGKDITDTKVDAITYSVVPSDAALIDPETGKLVVLKADSFQLICNVFGAEIVPSPTSVADTLGVLIYDEVEVIFPSDDVLNNVRPGDTIPGVRIQDQDKDITDLAKIKYTFEPDSMAHVDEDGNIIIDHAGDLKIKVEVTGEGLKDTTQEKSANINPYTVGEVTLPTIGNNNHVGDTIDMSNVKVLDEDGKDISEYATITYSFEPDSAAHVDPKTGNIIIDKSGNVKIVATISGNDVAPYSDDVEFFVKKYQTSDIILPEHQGEDYEPGDKIEKDDIQVLDKDGNDISDKSTITMTWEPADAAHLDSKGNLVFDKPGQIKVTTTISGEGVETMSKDTVYIIRHSEKGCKNLIAQVWDDVLAVNNNKETHVKMGIEQFVSYQWYREEEKLAGETAQDYHISAGEFKGDAYFYAYAYDINGKEYLLCEILVNETAQPAASSSFKIYPNMVAAHGKYTVEVAQAGTINITNSNGNAIDSYQVSKGMTDKMAPAAPGVYMLQYVPAEGKYEVLKLIVK